MNRSERINDRTNKIIDEEIKVVKELADYVTPSASKDDNQARSISNSLFSLFNNYLSFSRDYVNLGDDLSNIKQRITTLTLQSVGVDAEDKMIDIEKQAYVNSGIVQCVNDIFKAVGATDKYLKGLKEKADIKSFIQHLCKQITLVRDNAQTKKGERP